jgi:hypothetical protein
MMMLDRELVASSAEMRQGQGRLRAALSMRVCFYPHPPGEASHVQGVRKDCVLLVKLRDPFVLSRVRLLADGSQTLRKGLITITTRLRA